MKMEKYDMDYILSHVPKVVIEAIQKEQYRSKVFIAGGFIRGMIAREDVKDIDLFCTSREIADSLAIFISKDRIETENAYTIPGRIPIQIIFKWTFRTAKEVCDNFDFTICSAVIWFNSDWDSYVHERFYADLAAKRLVYTNPENHVSGGSLLRVLKYYKRGYNIPLNSLGDIIARLVGCIDTDKTDLSDEESVAYVITGLLVEVDPSIAPNQFDNIPKYDQ